MKKSLLILSLVMVLCLSLAFAACQPTVELEPETLKRMQDYLINTYRNVDPDFTYNMPTVVNVKGQTANVQWTVNTTEGPADVVKVGAAEGTNQAIEINFRTEQDVKYTLTGTIVNEKGEAYTIDEKPVTVSFDRTVSKFVLNTYEEYAAACVAGKEDVSITIIGYVIGVVNMESSSAGSLYLQDKDGNGYYAYAPTGATSGCETNEQLREKWPLGAEVVVTGTCTVYNGQYEFNKGCGAVATGAKVDPATLTYVDATADFAAAKSNKDTALTEYQNRRVTLKDAFITRVTTEYKDGKFSKRYYYFTLGESNVEFNVYYTIYFIDEATMQALDAQLQVGNMVDLTGVISVYSKDFQVYPDSATSVSNVRQVVKTDADKIALEKKNLSFVDTAVKGDEIALQSAGVFESTQITWAFAEGKDYSAVATIADGKLTITADPAETVKLEVVATITSGSTSETVTFEVTIPAARTSFIKAALVAGAALENKATTEDSYMIIGTISEITEAYSEQYGNVTFNVVDAEGNKLLIFRYKGENAATLKAGDAVAFAAPIKKYDSTIEAVAPFVALNITSLTDAAAAGLAGTGVAGTQVYGYVKSIDTPYSSEHGNITVTISDGTNDFYIYRLKGGEDLMINDYILITGTPSSYKEAAQMAAGATYVKSPIYVAPAAPAEKVTTIEAALSAEVGTPAELTGTVDRYNSTDFKDSYYIKDEAGKEILVYRANAEANIGDVVKVVGTIGAYNGVNQIAQGSTVTVITPAGGETPAECTNLCETCGKCLDKDCTQHTEKCEGHDAPEVITTIAGALAAADGAAVELTGTVTGHNGGFKSNFYIKDEAGNSIYVYYATSDVNIGDVVKVVGKVGSYEGAKQIAKGSTVTIVTPHTCDWADATCEKPAKCTICGVEKGEALGHTYVEGVCSVCGKDEPAAGTYSYSYTFESKVFSANGTVALGDKQWTLAGDSSYVGWDSNNGKGHQFGSSNNPYKSMTLTSESFSNVTEIIIKTSGASKINATLKVYVGSTLVDTITLTATATEYTIAVENLTGEVKFEYTQTSSKAIYINYITVNGALAE